MKIKTSSILFLFLLLAIIANFIFAKVGTTSVLLMGILLCGIVVLQSSRGTISTPNTFKKKLLIMIICLVLGSILSSYSQVYTVANMLVLSGLYLFSENGLRLEKTNTAKIDWFYLILLVFTVIFLLITKDLLETLN